MIVPLRCARRFPSGERCPNNGVLRPVLELRVYIGSKPRSVECKLEHCHSCAAEATIDDLLTDAGWVSIVNQCLKAGMKEPDRSLVVLRWLDQQMWTLPRY